MRTPIRWTLAMAVTLAACGGKSQPDQPTPQPAPPPAPAPAPAPAKPKVVVAKKEAPAPAKPKEDPAYPGLSAFTAQRTSSLGFKVRLAVVKDPTIRFEDAAKEAGIEPVVGSHAWTEWSYTKGVMELVQYVASLGTKQAA